MSRRLSPEVYALARTRLAELGYAGEVEWAQNVSAPPTAEDFAREYVWVVLNSGMKNTVARRIMDRVWPRLYADDPIAPVFGHRGKREAIEAVWRQRHWYFAQFNAAQDKLAFCHSLPWIGGITKYHLAKNLGLDVAKPDRWLQRLAAAGDESVEALCSRLAAASSDRVATVDVVLWRACAIGILRVAPGGVSLLEPAAAEA